MLKNEDGFWRIRDIVINHGRPRDADWARGTRPESPQPIGGFPSIVGGKTFGILPALANHHDCRFPEHESIRGIVSDPLSYR